MFEIKKLELQRMKINTGKAEMEFKILERLEDIKRLEENIKNQDNAVKEINEQINQLKGE